MHRESQTQPAKYHMTQMETFAHEQYATAPLATPNPEPDLSYHAHTMLSSIQHLPTTSHSFDCGCLGASAGSVPLLFAAACGLPSVLLT